MDEELKQHLREKKTWLRALYMLLFIVVYSVLKIIISAVVIFQFLFVLVTSRSNERLLNLGQSLTTYAYQILLFLTFNSEYHPYPFGAWPKGSPSQAEEPVVEKLIESDS